MQTNHKARYESVVIICPETITGGPEALHQLGHSINRLGGHAVMAYYGAQNLQVINRNLIGMSSPRDEFRSHYQCYSPITEESIALNDRTLVVFPEIFPIEALNFRWSHRAIWWLSVDHALDKTPALGYKTTADKIFYDNTLLHFCQSWYAINYLRQQGARQIIPVFDYVERSYRLSKDSAIAKVESTEIRKVAIFPRKGAELAKIFVDACPQFAYSLIESMSREDVGKTLADSSVYIDFGHLPGKDRVPREAALAGNIVFLHEKGSATQYGDFPVESYYLFTSTDVRDGNLSSRVMEVLSNYSDHLSRQAFFRQRVVLEQEEFNLQVASTFFILS
jgi:hypothetical protein